MRIRIEEPSGRIFHYQPPPPDYLKWFLYRLTCCRYPDGGVQSASVGRVEYPCGTIVYYVGEVGAERGVRTDV